MITKTTTTASKTIWPRKKENTTTTLKCTRNVRECYLYKKTKLNFFGQVNTIINKYFLANFI